jgi:hypothetical protein
VTRKPGITRPLRNAIANIKTTLMTLGASVHPHPLIVLGNQKSGTTAIAALLAQMVDLPVSLDLKKEIRNPTIDHVRRGDMTFEQFIHRNRLDFSRDIIKEPNLTIFYDELAARFPDSKFVMVIRDPRENLRSILQRLDLRGDLDALSKEQMNGLPTAWRLVIDGNWLGLDGDTYIDMLAARWNHTTDLYLRHSERTTLVRFEDFLEDKVGVIRQLAGSVGLTEHCDITSRVDTPFQPPGDRNVKWSDFFGSNLSRIEKICAEHMKRFDYTPGS